MSWDSANPIVPFDEYGNMLDYPAYDSVMRPVQPFDARMTLVGAERGRSAARFLWQDEQGRRWPMFLTDMLDLIQRGEILEGSTRVERWTVRKRGMNYGLALMSETGS